MRSGVGWEEDESIGWVLKKVRKYFSANIKPANTASGGVVKKSPWVRAIVKQKKWKWAFLHAGSLIVMWRWWLYCVVVWCSPDLKQFIERNYGNIFARTITIEAVELWTSNQIGRIFQVSAEIVPEFWLSSLYFSANQRPRKTVGKNSLRSRELQWSTCHGW